MRYSRIRKTEEKTDSLNQGGPAEGRWNASNIQMVTAKKHNHRPEGTTDGSVHAQEKKKARASQFNGHKQGPEGPNDKPRSRKLLKAPLVSLYTGPLKKIRTQSGGGLLHVI